MSSRDLGGYLEQGSSGTHRDGMGRSIIDGLIDIDR